MYTAGADVAGSAGVSPAVEAASRRLSVGEEARLRRFPGFGFDSGRDARRTAGETPALPGFRAKQYFAFMAHETHRMEGRISSS